MNKEDRIFTRRQLLDWRDKHIENIHHHLSREISLLFNELDYEIDKMTLKDSYNSESYTKKHLEPIYLRWIKNEVSIVNQRAKLSRVLGKRALKSFQPQVV